MFSHLPRKTWLLVAIILIVVTAIFLRFYHLPERLFFVYDQGRDAIKLKNILTGDLILVGPTSGLAGFFLGPLWYYVGIPGYLLSQGNPYGISAWYIFLSLTALPAFWLVSKKLFTYPWSLISFALLSLIPGAVKWGIFIWNPLISVPLMGYAFLAFLYARKSRLALTVGFFCLALTLQSEFAYAVFFIAPLFVLIPWIRQKLDVKDFVASGGAIAVTLLPQLLFELRNQFILTKSLLGGVTQGQGIGYLQLWQSRPFSMYYYSSTMLLGYPRNLLLFSIPVALCLLAGIYLVLSKLNRTKLFYPNEKVYAPLLLILFFVLPYAGFLAWRGNEGNFFDYYLTPHFIFITLVVVVGMEMLWELKIKTKKAGASLLSTVLPWASKGVVAISLVIFLFCIGKYAYDFVLFPVNNAGLQTIEKAVNHLYSWRAQSGDEKSSMLVFTPAYQNEQYDYIIYWKAHSQNKSLPSSVRQEGQTDWFLLLERNDSDISEYRFKEWYPKATAGGVLKEKKQIGILELEWWQRSK